MQSVLTSGNNALTLPAGYYDSVTISTNITTLKGTISYLHHQCSNTVADSTYTDTSIGASGAVSVSEITVNGQTVSTTQGGCYTTPYYQYTHTVKTKSRYVSSIKRPSYNYISGAWMMVIFYYDKDGNQTKADTLGACNETESPVYTYGEYETTTTATGYGTSVPSGGTLKNTYYLKTCGHTNGELLSVTITY